MNEIAQQIINLDKETVALREKYEELLRERKFEGLDMLQKLEQELMKSYVEEGERAYREIMQNSPEDSAHPEKVEVEYMSSMINVDVAYSKVKDELVESLWKEILAGEE